MPTVQRSKKMKVRIFWTTLAMGAIFGAYETVKTLLLPNISIVESHIISTVVVIVITLVTGRSILARQEQLTEATEQTNRLLHTVLEAMQEGILIIDSQAHVTLRNRAAERIFTFPETAGQKPRLVDVTRDPVMNDAFRRVMEEGTVIQERIDFVRASPRSFQVTIAPLQRPGERPFGALGVFVEITKLEELERVRRDFFANLSHELRTPLTAILANAETLRDGALDDRENSLKFLDAIFRHTQRMYVLVRDITDLSEIESGNVGLNLADVPLRPVVDDVIALNLPQAEEEGVTIYNQVPEDIVVVADSSRLEQILNNLTDNGVKFNHPGGKVWITAHRDDGDHVHVSVNDDGIGIPPGDQPRIFERFYRTDKSRSRTTGGSGLGLAIVKHLVHAHGGELKVESTPEVGSEFSFTLKPAKELSTEKAAIS
jgi:two-component system phosphate regulon sensor histidine kinase PhoR